MVFGRIPPYGCSSDDGDDTNDMATARRDDDNMANVSSASSKTLTENAALVPLCDAISIQERSVPSIGA